MQFIRAVINGANARNGQFATLLKVVKCHRKRPPPPGVVQMPSAPAPPPSHPPNSGQLRATAAGTPGRCCGVPVGRLVLVPGQGRAGAHLRKGLVMRAYALFQTRRRAAVLQCCMCWVLHSDHNLLNLDLLPPEISGHVRYVGGLLSHVTHCANPCSRSVRIPHALVICAVRILAPGVIDPLKDAHREKRRTHLQHT